MVILSEYIVLDIIFIDFSLFFPGLFQCDKVSESLVDELTSQFPHVFISTLKTEIKKSQMKKSSIRE